MFDISNPRIKPESRDDKYILENIKASRTSSFIASTKNAYLDSPSLKNIFNIDYHGDDPDMLYLKNIHASKEENQKISKEDFESNHAESGLAYDPNFTPAIIEDILEKRRKMDINNYIIENGKNDLLDRAGQIAGSIVGGNVAPTNLSINIATGFIPVGAVVRGAWWASNPVKANMVKFAIGGGIGQAALEPLIHGERDLEQREYGLGDSLQNIAEASAFSAALPFASAGIKSGYGIGKGKYGEYRRRYFASPEELNAEYSTNSASLDMQFKHLVDELATETTPRQAPPVLESFETLNMYKSSIRDEGIQKFPEFFVMEEKLASLEESLHKEFSSGGDISMLPEQISSILTKHRENLQSILKKFEGNEEFEKIISALNEADTKISNKLQYEQSEAKAYDLDQTDLAIARNQLENDKYIDLDDPKNAKSIFDQNYTEHQDLDIQKQISELEELTKTLPNFENHKIELDKLVGGASILGENVDLSSYRDKLMGILRLENAKQTILSRNSIRNGFEEILKQTDMRGVVVSTELGNGLMNDLSKANLLDFFKNKKFENDIAKELWNITHPNKKPTNSKISADIAKIIHKWQQQGITRINNAGAHIQGVDGYITRQSHNGFKMKEHGYDAWRDYIAPLLDIDRCDSDLDLVQIFDNLATGKHLYQNNEYMPHFKHHTNISDKFSHARKLHFKSADSWLKYNNEYGTHSLAHSVAINLDKLGRNIGLLESMGSNPYEFLGSLKNEFAPYLQELAANKDKHAQKELDFISRDSLDRILESIIGVTPESPNLAVYSASVRNLVVMANLGKVVISSIPDMGMFVTEQMHNGIPYIEAQANLVKVATNSFNSTQKKEYARLLGVGTDNLMGLAYCRLNAEQHISGKIAGGLSTATNYYFKFNLMNWWDDSFKSTLGFVLSNNLAHHTKTSYKNAPIELRNNLQRYGLDQKDWNILNSFIKKADDGREYIITPEWVAGNIQANEVAAKFKTYLKDRVDTGIATPHKFERYAATLGTKAGTPLGEAMRFLIQFKQFPITYWMRGVKDYKGTPKTLSTMLILSAMGGYASIAANKMLNGEDIPELDSSILQASILKGGGLGLYGDFIFGQYNRYGHNIYQAMASPAVAAGADIFSILGDVAEGKTDDATKKAEMLAHRMTPFRNLFYLAPALRGGGVSNEWIDRNLNAKNIK